MIRMLRVARKTQPKLIAQLKRHREKNLQIQPSEPHLRINFKGDQEEHHFSKQYELVTIADYEFGDIRQECKHKSWIKQTFGVNDKERAKTRINDLDQRVVG